MPIPNEKALGNVVTRSFGAAVFIHASGHPPLRIHSRDGTAFGAHWVFAPEARSVLEHYYRSRDALNAFGAEYPAHSHHEDTRPNELRHA